MLANTDVERKKRNPEAPVQALAPKDPAVGVKGSALSEKIADQKKFDSELVTGKFFNLRAKGQSAKLTYMKYADDPVKWYTFEHGQVYTIPRGFADQINEHYYIPHFTKNENAIIDPSNPGSGIHSIDTSDKMYSFVGLNY